MLTDFMREWSIYRTLKSFSRQRVAVILQPGDVWVIEKAVKASEKIDANLRTCQLRGWIEPISNAIPKGRLTTEGNIPPDVFNQVGPLYRLTDSGWAAIHRTHILTLFGVFLALITVIISLKP